ncbi:MAG TPA: AmmeMemoRadiSam system radical SAM enzyme [archaeon]|nr:AmmeMemoRadiSam system radical SAM enzyme [archaeon]
MTHEASYYKSEETGIVKCALCPHHCSIALGRRGICGVRENRNGRLMSLVYGKLAASHVDPIEKKPLFHFFPGSTAYSVATVGCNLSCPFCQNHELSSSWRHQSAVPGHETSVERVVNETLASHCKSVCFTYSEPTIFFEYMLDIAKLSKNKGLRTTMVSNGFIEKEPLRELSPFLDGANIDLKAFSQRTYREIIKADLQPVCDTIADLPGLGVWCEVTTLLVPGMNDSDEELKDIAAFLAGCGTGIPWHVSRFYPHYKWNRLESTPVAALRRALEIGKEAGLKYIYVGNVPGDRSESTFCPACGKLVIERFGFSIGETHLEPGGYCAYCKNQIEGVFE